MPTGARAARVVDSFMGNWLLWVAPTPLLPEKFRERSGMNAAQVADVHDVAPRLGHGQHGPLVAGERSPRLVARRARRAVLNAPREIRLQSVVTLRAALARRAVVASVVSRRVVCTSFAFQSACSRSGIKFGAVREGKNSSCSRARSVGSIQYHVALLWASLTIAMQKVKNPSGFVALGAALRPKCV